MITNKNWDDFVDPARLALEALIAEGDKVTDHFEELERLVMQERAKLAALQEENAKLRSKIAKQRNEIGRLMHKLEDE